MAKVRTKGRRKEGKRGSEGARGAVEGGFGGRKWRVLIEEVKIKGGTMPETEGSSRF